MANLTRHCNQILIWVKEIFGGKASLRRVVLFMNNFPDIMRQAKEDLGGSVSGHFSPEDWQQILLKAERDLQQKKNALNGDETEAWQDVIRDFHQQNFWGFTPNYRPPPRPKKKGNLGVAFIWMAFQTFVITKIAVLWIGQTYARSQDPHDFWLLCLVISLVVANFAYFLWKNRNHV